MYKISLELDPLQVREILYAVEKEIKLITKNGKMPVRANALIKAANQIREKVAQEVKL